MLQLLGLRSFVSKEDGKEKKYDAFFKNKWRVSSVQELFKNLDKHLEQIPEKERWNLFYTVANCSDEKRDFLHQDVLAFDIDKTNPKFEDSYQAVVCSVLGIPASKVGFVNSGNGYHFLVGLSKPIQDKIFFKEYKDHYKEVCKKIKTALEKAGLPGEPDSSIFEPRRLLRLPGTENRKPDKKTKVSRILQPVITPVNLDLAALAGIPIVARSEQISKDFMRKYPKTDPEAVLESCDFLQWAKKSPDELDEPTWYAMLSITARLNGDDPEKDGHYWSHELSKSHSSYSPEETDEKIEQALAASGPRTCENINALWGKCKTCKMNDKVKSPIQIVGKNFIPTEFTGFHYQDINGKSKPTPAYLDLVKYFERENPFVCLHGTRMCYVYRDNYYQMITDAELEAYAFDKFNPKTKGNIRREWRDLVNITNIKPAEWFSKSTEGFINFQNGILDFNKMVLDDHSTELGFRYILPYNYDPQAKAPGFQKMLTKVTQNDTDLQKILLEYMGYCLSNDDYWEHKALVLEGEGSNGKSTFLQVLKMLAGKGNYSSLVFNDMEHEYNRSLMEGKLFNVSEETPSKSLANGSLFKTLTSGGEIHVRAIYKEPYFIASKTKQILSCNELPKSYDNSHGFYRRLLIVPFHALINKKDPDYDPFILRKVEKELSGIFNLAIEAYRSMKARQAFTSSTASDAVKDEYEMQSNTVKNWFSEYMHVDVNDIEKFVTTQDLYAHYARKCEEQTLYKENIIQFSRVIKKEIPQELYHRVDSIRGYRGISFTDDPNSDGYRAAVIKLGIRKPKEF